MKKIIAILCCAFVFTLLLSGCFDSTVYPDMVEYDSTEVLAVAKSKYDIKSFAFTHGELHGKKHYDEETGFSVALYTKRFGDDFINGDNIDAALTAFAGKNGGHDIQGIYMNFLCYVALGVRTDGQAKFIYYNLNLNKDAVIEDTIGCSDYPYDILPTEITGTLLTPPQDWNAMNVYMNGMKAHYSNIVDGLTFSGDRLSYGYGDRNHQYAYLEFYRENGRIVYDLKYVDDTETDGDPKLIYSTSDRYGVIYNYYGIDKNTYVDVNYSVTQSTEDPTADLLEGTVKIKPLDGTVIYSELLVRASYKVLNTDGKVITHENSSKYRFTTEVEKGFLIDRIDGVNHGESAKITCVSFYILYEKTV